MYIWLNFANATRHVSHLPFKFHRMYFFLGKTLYILNKLHIIPIFCYLPPYSGAIKCIFFILSLHVLTWWWIASGATAEIKSYENKVRKCIQLCLRDCGFSRFAPQPTHPTLTAGQFHTQRPRSDSWRQLILPTFETRPCPSADLCHRWHTASPRDRARPMFLCVR